VFVKKEASFQERGVGMLYLKPAGEKTQLIVRADTSLGNLLVNTLLTAKLPIQRMGTNNVILVCIPTPDTKPPPIPVLLRLKTSADADEVFNKLKQHIE
jgi:nuclear pore complex protein Nup50